MISGSYPKIGEEQKSLRDMGWFCLVHRSAFLGSRQDLMGKPVPPSISQCHLEGSEIPASPPRMGPKPGHSEHSLFWITVITLG